MAEKRLTDHEKNVHGRDTGDVVMGRWQAKTLDELCKIARGGSPRPIKEYLTDAPGGVNWIKISDATASTKYIFSTKEKIKPEGVKRSRMVHEGDFLLSNSMSFGRPYIMKTSGCIHDGWLVLTDKSGLLDQNYLYYFLGSSAAYRQFDARASGSTVRNLNIGLVRSVEVPLPPLPEQERIVAILDEAFTAIAMATANAEKNLANARELFENEIYRVFSQPGEGWSATTLRNEVDFLAGFAFRSSEYTELADGIRLLRGDNIVQGKLRWEGAKRLPWEGVGEYAKFNLMENDVVLAMDRPWVTAGLKIAAIQESDLPCLQVQRTARLRAGLELHWNYLLHLLRSKAFIQYIIGGQTGLGVPHISGKQILDFEFPRPSISEQQAIIDEINALSTATTSLQAVYCRKQDSLTELKQSILHKAFTGELTADTKAHDRTLSEAGV